MKHRDILAPSGELDRLLAPLYKCAKGRSGFVNEPVSLLARAFLFFGNRIRNGGIYG